MIETRKVHDPFLGEDVQISNRLVDRLRGQYASGPHLPNGKPEFGWRQFQAPPIQHEAAARIEELEAKFAEARIKAIEECAEVADALAWCEDDGSERQLEAKAIAKAIRSLLSGVGK